MSKLNVEIDYVRVAQFVKVVESYLEKIKNELDLAVVNSKIKGESNENILG